MFFTYVLKNEVGKIYIGQTSDLGKRLKRHNGLLVASNRRYTKLTGKCWKVVYKEEFTARVEAVKREKYLKSHHGRDWLKKILAR